MSKIGFNLKEDLIKLTQALNSNLFWIKILLYFNP